MSRSRLCVAGSALLFVTTSLFTGCLNVKAPEQINVGTHPQRVDSSRVPPTRSHEEARQLLARAYERNRYLEAKASELKRDNKKLKQERDEYKRRYERAQSSNIP